MTDTLFTVPGDARRKPTLPRLNRGHPLAQGLEIFTTLHDTATVEPVRGLRPTVTTVNDAALTYRNVALGDYGVHFAHGTTQQTDSAYLDYDDGVAGGLVARILANGGEFTVMSRFIIHSFNGSPGHDSIGVDSTSGANGFRLFRVAGNTYFRFRMPQLSTANHNTSAGTAVEGQIQTVVCIRGPGTQVRVVIDNVIDIDTTATGTVTGSGEPYTLGVIDGNWTPKDSTVLATAAWSRALTESEIFSLHTEPYAVVAPPRSVPVVVPPNYTLARPHVRTSRKPAMPRLNRSHPLTRGLVFCAPIFEGGGDTRDMVTGAMGALGASGTGSNPTWETTTRGRALDWTRTNNDNGSKVDFGNDVRWTPTAITASAWIWADSTIAARRAIAGMWDAGAGDRSWCFGFLQDATLQVWVSSSGTDYDGREWTVTINTSQWYHVVMSWDGATAGAQKLYVDGVDQGSSGVASTSGTPNSGVYNGAANLQVGALEVFATDTCPWDGKIENVCVWNRQLTNVEIQQLHAEPYALVTPPRSVPVAIPIPTPDTYTLARPHVRTNRKPSQPELNRGHSLARGLRFYAPLAAGGGDARDLVLGATGTLTNVGSGTNAAWATTSRGRAVNFTHTSKTVGSKIDFGSNSSQWCPAYITVSAWVYRTQDTTNDAYMIGGVYDNTTNNRSWELFCDADTDTIDFIVSDDGTDWDQRIWNNKCPINTWVHVVVTWNGVDGGQALYIDGIDQGTADASDGSAGAVTTSLHQPASTPLLVGCITNSSSNDFPWDGDIEQFAIWDRVLTANEIQQLYAEPYALITPAQSTPIGYVDTREYSLAVA